MSSKYSLLPAIQSPRDTIYPHYAITNRVVDHSAAARRMEGASLSLGNITVFNNSAQTIFKINKSNKIRAAHFY